MINFEIYDLEFKFLKEKYSFYPSSIKFDEYYLATEFEKILKNKKVYKLNSETEISNINQINSKYLYCIDDDIFISYVKINDLENANAVGIIIDVVLYYNTEKHDDNSIKKIVDDISDKVIIMDDNATDSETSNRIVNLLSYSFNSGYNLIPKYIDLKCNFDPDFYIDGTIDKATFFIKNLNETSNNIYFICGNKGVGKTQLLKYITNNINKEVIFIPINMVEHIMQPEFQKFIDNFKDCLFVIEDIEMYVTNNYNRNPILMKTIIQTCSGYLANLNIDYIMTANCNYVELLDKDLLNFSNILVLEKIPYEKAIKVVKKMKSKIKLNKNCSYSLSDIKNESVKNKVGY